MENSHGVWSGLNSSTNTVGNWFEMLDKWFDTKQWILVDDNLNGYQW